MSVEFEITVTIKPPEPNRVIEHFGERLIGYLMIHGSEEAPAPTPAICKAIGVRDARELREVASHMRGHGTLIGSRPGRRGGYWLGNTIEDVQETIDTNTKAVKSLLWSLHGMKRGIVGEGQLVLL